MTIQPLWEGAERLHKLLAEYLGGKIDSELFCENFEQAFNFEVDRSRLTAIESAVFGRLFNEVVYFSPIPGEIAMIPNYRGEGQLRQAARNAQAELCGNK